MKIVDTRGRVPKAAGVFVLAGLFAFYLSIISIAGATVERLLPTLEARLSSQVTVVVWGRGLESADAAAARAAELLTAQAGVRRADVLDADRSDTAVAELIAGSPLGVEQPRLVSVNGEPSLLPPASNLRKLLNANRLTVSLDDHRGTSGPLETRMLVLGVLGIASGVILCGGLFGVCFKGGLSAADPGTPRLDLMTRLGADPVFIAAIVARRSGLLGLAGAILATLCADIAVFAAFAQRSWFSLEIRAIFQLRLTDGMWTALWPIVVALIAAAASGLGAWRGIVRRERTL